MPQPIPKKKAARIKTTKPSKVVKEKKTQQKYGVSKLEDYFAENFLDVLGVKYVRQYEAKDIGRFYDFFCPDANVIIEVDGDYYHSYGLTYEEKNPMQKHNEWVDKVKDEWALSHGIQESIGKYTEKQRKKDAKRKRH